MGQEGLDRYSKLNSEAFRLGYVYGNINVSSGL
jgi:hypothetical protein